MVMFLKKRRKYHKLRDVKKPETAIFPQKSALRKSKKIKKGSVLCKKLRFRENAGSTERNKEEKGGERRSSGQKGRMRKYSELSKVIT